MTAPPQWKVKPWRCKAYGLYVRTLPCALTGHRATEWMAVDPHHEERPGHSGTGTKACDSRQIPIRHDLHVLMESPGNSRAAVYARYGKDPEEIIGQTQEEWARRGNSKAWEAVTG